MWICAGHDPVRLFGDTKTVLKDRQLPALIHGFMQDIGKHSAAAKDALVEHYDDLWREAWSHGFDGSLSRDEFSAHLAGPSVSYPDGQYLRHFTVSYDPGTLFGDHLLYVVMAPDGTLIDHGMM